MNSEISNQYQDELDVSNRTYTKVTNKLSNNGFFNGITEGKDTVFQDGFDNGYQLGFNSSFLTGQYKGIISAIKNIPSHPKQLFKCIKKDEDTAFLSKISRGNCQICCNKELINESIEIVSEIQCKYREMFHGNLIKTYKDIYP